MIAVDTSVGIAALRDRKSVEARGLEELLDLDQVGLPAPVRVEILAAARRTDRAHLRRVLSALPVLHPREATWRTIDTWIDRAGDAGERFGFADLLIGALASEHDAPVWSLDDDFAHMARIGLIEIHRP